MRKHQPQRTTIWLIADNESVRKRGDQTITFGKVGTAVETVSVTASNDGSAMSMLEFLYEKGNDISLTYLN